MSLDTFPEIFADDLFHLELPRLWLRWPTATDNYTGPFVTSNFAKIATFTKAEVENNILACRSENLSSKAVHLAIAHKSKPMSMIGIVSINFSNSGTPQLGFWIGEIYASGTIMAEAITGFLRLLWLSSHFQFVDTVVATENSVAYKIFCDSGFYDQSRTSDQVILCIKRPANVQLQFAKGTEFALGA